MQVNRSAKVEMSRITTLLRQGSQGTKSSINGLGQHILMKGLLVREYLAPDANAIAVLGRSVSIGQQEQGSVQENLVRRNKYYLWIILD